MMKTIWKVFQMVVCKYCNGEMGVAIGCIPLPVVFKDTQKQIKRLRYGVDDEQDQAFHSERCPDCGCKVGGYHHVGCDIEKCPRCEGQFISCECPK